MASSSFPACAQNIVKHGCGSSPCAGADVEAGGLEEAEAMVAMVCRVAATIMHSLAEQNVLEV